MIAGSLIVQACRAIAEAPTAALNVEPRRTRPPATIAQ